jgi:uncharacterized protein with PIN domain
MFNVSDTVKIRNDINPYKICNNCKRDCMFVSPGMLISIGKTLKITGYDRHYDAYYIPVDETKAYWFYKECLRLPKNNNLSW